MIRRRAFIGGTALALGGFLVRPGTAQPYPGSPRRAAVVIGVDRTGDLPTLNDAVSGATAFGDFLEEEGFAPVHRFLSSDGPVRPGPLKEAVRDLVGPGNLDQIVIYFAGHGLRLPPANEIWLLSDAPDDLDAAIKVRECFEAARASGVSNVVLIGDTCRSLPRTDLYGRIDGEIIFPGLPSSATATTIDIFYATQPGQAALEVEASSGSYRAIFTTTLIEVFRNPDLRLDESMFTSMPDGTRIVSNGALSQCLPDLVDERAQAAGLALSQRPQLDILSREPWNIGSVRFPAAAPPGGDGNPPPPGPVPQVRTLPEFLRAEFGGNRSVTASDEIRAAAEERLGASVETQMSDIDLDGPGLAVYGAKIARVVALPGLEVTIEQSDRVGSARVALGDQPAASVLVTFDDGRAAPVAVLRDYGAHLTVGATGVESFRCTPLVGTDAYADFVGNRERVTRLRALVREASKQGVLGFDGDQESREGAAERLAGQIRMAKGIDPTLGLYAAYAYDAALLPEQVQSVAFILEGTLGVRLFDPAMLAWSLIGAGPATAENRCFPFCPVLRQGWDLVRVKQATLAAPLVESRPHLLPSLVTTFSPDGAAIVARAIEMGDLS